MTLPIETVLDLLILNAQNAGVWFVRTDKSNVVASKSLEDVRNGLRVYLQSLIPPPVLLSECEEDSPVVVKDRFGEWGVAIRVGEIGYSMHNDPRHRKPLGYAETIKVIQPVEVT